MGWLADETGLGKTQGKLCAVDALVASAACGGCVLPIAPLWCGKSTRLLSYADYATRVSQLAAALAQRGIQPGDVVATLLPNIPAQAERISACPPAVRC